MSFCKNCGNPLNEGAGFCTKCGKKTEKDSVNLGLQQSQEVYEEFTPLLGLGGKRWVISTNSLIYGNDTYTYEQLNPIILISAPTPLTNGVARTTVNGKVLTLGYAIHQKERFNIAITYANERIDSAHGKTKDYKYIFQATTGSKIEIYEDYLIIYYMSANANGIMGKASEKAGTFNKGFGKLIDSIGSVGTAMGNISRGGSSGKIIMFTDLTILQLNADSLIINEYSIPVSQNTMGLANEIVAYIEESRKSEKANTQTQFDEQENWQPIKGVAKTFTLLGQTLEVPENMDVFNSYRLKFRELAFKYADNTEKEYTLRVRDFITFIEFFPKIYISNLEPLIQKAVDILITESVWTVTFDSFKEQHLTDFHLAFETYEKTVESVALTSEANQQATAGLMSFVPNLIGGGFGVKGALKGMATAAAFNTVRDGIENNAIKNAANINPEQQAELYGRIKPEILMRQIFTDYWRVFLSLVRALNQNGHNIWWQTDEAVQQAKNIFQNLSNPNFPQGKILGAIIGLLELNPYNPEYYKFIISRFGESEEVTAIKDYFGYYEGDPRIT
ncbi:MAG: zinc ribbon domain-containing protein [Eubacteriales bacterium]|nr:zinc ribbon domain-containing protein [Eubacteriales bacterium]